MTIQEIKESIPDYAKDIRINITRVLTEENSKGLSEKQIFAVALACALASKDQALVASINSLSSDILDEADIQGVRSAVTIMAMNNVYYRTIGMISDKNFTQRQPGLRMQIIGNPGIEKIDFELYCLAVSAINGCHHCVDSHVGVLQQAGLSDDGIQSSIRIASVINALAQVNTIEAPAFSAA